MIALANDVGDMLQTRQASVISPRLPPKGE